MWLTLQLCSLAVDERGLTVINVHRVESVIKHEVLTLVVVIDVCGTQIRRPLESQT